MPSPLVKDEVLEGIHKAQFRGLPTGYKAIMKGEKFVLPDQEKGVRQSCALPYELYVDGHLGADAAHFTVSMRVGDEFFGSRTAGAPFMIYAYGREVKVRNYAVVAGGQLTDHFSLGDFEGGRYDLRVYGPNGFYRRFAGGPGGPSLKMGLDYERNGETPTGRLMLRVVNTDKTKSYTLQIRDNAYGTASHTVVVGENSVFVSLDLRAQGGWYDLSVLTEGADGYEQRMAGRVETGRDSISDPAMG